MKFVMFMIPRVYQPGTPPEERAGEGFIPPADRVEKMMKYNEELAKAGVLVTLDGLHPPAKGARVTFGNGKPVVIDGPFIETKEVIGGYWLIQTQSMEEAVEWARRCPAVSGDIIEIRRVFEMTDFPPPVREAAADRIRHQA